jgi:alpha-L-rhamnosidase
MNSAAHKAGEAGVVWLGVHGKINPLFRCPFTLAQPLERVIGARLRCAGLGCYVARLNGRKVGDIARAPEYTDYWNRILCQEYAVQDLLRDGANVLGMALGRGWFERFEYGVTQFFAHLEIAFADGSVQRVGPDHREWRTASGPTLEADPFHGETCDARLERPGWDSPGFDEQGEWIAISPINEQVPGRVEVQSTPPIRITQEIIPVSVRTMPGGAQIVDFGQNIAGWVRLSAHGRSGVTVRLRFAELLNEDGSLDPRSIRGAQAMDRYTLRGGATETWEPAFTYHGFRYVEVVGLPALPDEWSVKACVAHTDLPRRGRFACSDERLNRLHANVDWSLRANTMSVFTDCPQRDERQGWLGDGHLIAETMLHHFDAAPFYAKWMADIRETQDAAGNRWGACAPPWYARGRRLPPHRYATQTDLVWSAAGTLIPWEVYLHDGDVEVLKANAPAIFSHAMYLAGRPDFPLIDAVTIGDHLFPGWGTEKDPTNFILLGAAFALRQTDIAAETARILGDEERALRFRAIAGEYRAALGRRFYDAASGGFGSQTADALALTFDFAPDSGRVLSHLVADIGARNGHLNTGIVGTRYLLEALSRHGRSDVAWRVVTAEGFPGWMDMIANGATTITERWTYRGHWKMNSHNHPALGSVGAWLFRWIGGIQLDPADPGYRRITLDPYCPPELPWAEAELSTRLGRLAIRWERQGGRLRVSGELPESCEGTFLQGSFRRRLGAGRFSMDAEAT